MTQPATAADIALPDRTLIRGFLDGDEAAFGVLYHRHTPRLRMIVRRLLGPHTADVDEVVQETWLAGCRGLHGFNGTGQFATWLTTIGIRAARDRLRLPMWSDTELADDVAARPAPATATVVDLERAMARLPDHQRAVLVLHDVEGFTHEEIGTQLGVTTGTSKATLSLAPARRCSAC